MITDQNILTAQSYIEEWKKTGIKNPMHIEFCIQVYNFNNKNKLVRKKCGCDYKDKYATIGKWIKSLE